MGPTSYPNRPVLSTGGRQYQQRRNSIHHVMFLTSWVLALAAFLEVDEDLGEMVHVLAIKNADCTL